MHPDLPLDQILIGDCRELLKTLPDESVHMIVTSPPYWGLRSYGTNLLLWTNGHEPCIEHQWGEPEQLERENHNGQGNSTLRGGNVRPDEAWNTGTAGKKPVTNTCSVCGAWRGELGLEPTPELYVEHLVQIFHEVRRVLRDDGTIWVNLGDSYASTKVGNTNEAPDKKPRPYFENGTHLMDFKKQLPPGLKPKDLVGIPWMVAFALRADGWYLRSDIIWAKPNPMPESVTDRPTKSHEYIFLLSKSQKYYYDADAVREQATADNREYFRGNDKYTGGNSFDNSHQKPASGRGHVSNTSGYRNRRTVWTVEDERALLEWLTENYPDTAQEFFSMQHERKDVWQIATHPFKGAHFATFPPKLIEPCILAGTSARGVCSKCGAPWERVTERGEPDKETTRGKQNWAAVTGQRDSVGGLPHRDITTLGWRPTCACDAGEPVPAVVLDPFMGSGTTASVCISLKRHYIGFDLNPAYVEGLAQDRADNTPPPLFVW